MSSSSSSFIPESPYISFFPQNQDSSSISNTTTPAGVFQTPIPQIRRKDAVGTPGSKFDVSSINVVLDGLKLNDPEYTFERIMNMMVLEHPSLTYLFDQFHFFTNEIGGIVGKTTDAFWSKGELKGKRYLVDMVKDALQENLDSIEISEVPNLPFTKYDFADYIQSIMGDQEYYTHPGVKSEINSDEFMQKRQEALLEFVKLVNDKNKHYRLIIPRNEMMGDKRDWLLYTIDIFIDAAWHRIHLVDLKHPIIRYPTELSVVQWIDQISVKKDVEGIRRLLSKNENSAEHVLHALLKATEPPFSSAFIEAMGFAKQKHPSINVLDRRFISLIRDNDPFKRLVADIYLRNTSTAGKFSSTKSMIDHRLICSASISKFLSHSAFSSPFVMLNNNNINSNSSLSIQDFFQQKKSIVDYLIP